MHLFQILTGFCFFSHSISHTQSLSTLIYLNLSSSSFIRHSQQFPDGGLDRKGFGQVVGAVKGQGW